MKHKISCLFQLMKTFIIFSISAHYLTVIFRMAVLYEPADELTKQLLAPSINYSDKQNHVWHAPGTDGYGKP